MWQGVAERRCDDGGPLKLPTRFHASKPLAIGGASIDDIAVKEIDRGAPATEAASPCTIARRGDGPLRLGITNNYNS